MSRAQESLLWEVQSPDGRLNYLYGTIHLQDDRVFIFANEVLKRIDGVEVLACEVHLDHMDPIRWQATFHLPADLSLEALIGRKYFKRLVRFSDRYLKLPALHLDRLSPFFVMNVMSQAYFQSDQKVNLDTYLFDYARQMGKTLVGLEPFEEQLSYVARISMVEQVRSLKRALAQENKLKKQHEQALCYYQEQQLNALYKQSRKSLGKWRKMMINERNQKMVVPLRELCTEQTELAAVGAAHLPGKYGMIRLLKKEGFNVRPIIIKPKHLPEREKT
ncbi:MAG: TraB/GumN family protein [Bacteroidota bacterium]